LLTAEARSAAFDAYLVWTAFCCTRENLRAFVVNGYDSGGTMSAASEKLRKDVAILSAMTAVMDSYLKSDILFWKLDGGMPMLTLGGYFMRERRLLALPHLLSMGDQEQVETAVFQFNQAIVEKIVRLETKANKEIDARIRQLDEYLRDLQNKKVTGLNYGAAIEPRVMIAALVDKLSLPPWHLDEHIPQRLAILDQGLRRQWTPGEFVWPDGWQPAYPQDEYWWLYGRPV
jgi:hypothetical protein